MRRKWRDPGEGRLPGAAQPGHRAQPPGPDGRPSTSMMSQRGKLDTGLHRILADRWPPSGAVFKNTRWFLLTTKTPRACGGEFGKQKTSSRDCTRADTPPARGLFPVSARVRTTQWPSRPAVSPTSQACPRGWPLEGRFEVSPARAPSHPETWGRRPITSANGHSGWVPFWAMMMADTVTSVTTSPSRFGERGRQVEVGSSSSPGA